MFILSGDYKANLVARAAEDGVGQVADDDIEGAVVALQLSARIVDDQVHARVREGRLVGLQVLLAEVAHHLHMREHAPISARPAALSPHPPMGSSLITSFYKSNEEMVGEK